jgi:CBS domain-containing protein
MAKTADILAKKGTRVICIPPTASVLDATRLMCQHRIGSLVVTVNDEDSASSEHGCQRVVGMFTERDVLTRVVGNQINPAKTLVEQVMSTNIAYVRPDTQLEDVGAIMKERRIRHLPVCDDRGRLQGLVSIGDLNAWHSEGLAVEIHYLHEYIYGRV